MRRVHLDKRTHWPAACASALGQQRTFWLIFGRSSCELAGCEPVNEAGKEPGRYKRLERIVIQDGRLTRNLAREIQTAARLEPRIQICRSLNLVFPEFAKDRRIISQPGLLTQPTTQAAPCT